MESVDFNGFDGMRLDDAIYSTDIILLVVVGLLLTFALLFRYYYPLFNNMLGYIKIRKQGDNVFDLTHKDSFFFNLFMTFQALFLSSVLIIFSAIEYKRLTPPDETAILLAIADMLAFLFVFYLLRIALYSVFKDIYFDRPANAARFSHYHALLGLFGISLYIPVLWILLIGRPFWIACMMAAISYPLFRALFFRQFTGQFFNRNRGVTFVSLYLFAQEIVPVALLYEGVFYIYNMIEKK